MKKTKERCEFMPTRFIPKEILDLIKPQQVCDYAIANGWQIVPNVNGYISLFNHPKGQYDQLIVPMDDSMDDYSRRIRELVEILADFESRPVLQILNDMCGKDFLEKIVAL